MQHRWKLFDDPSCCRRRHKPSWTCSLNYSLPFTIPSVPYYNSKRNIGKRQKLTKGYVEKRKTEAAVSSAECIYIINTPFKWWGRTETLPKKGETKQKRISGPLPKKDNKKRVWSSTKMGIRIGKGRRWQWGPLYNKARAAHMAPLPFSSNSHLHFLANHNQSS